jgi:WD40 repeat protein
VSDLYLWDVATKHIIRRYTGLATFPFTIDLSQDSKYVISGTSKGEVIVWNFTTGEEVSRINTHFSVWCVSFSTDGKTAFIGTDQGRLIEWHFADKPLSELLNWIKSNRYLHEFTCDERQQYNLEPLCNEENP